VSAEVAVDNVATIAAGFHHSLALTSSGKLFAFGDNGYYQLGDQTKTDSSTPKLIADSLGEEEITSIATGQNHVLAINASGALYGWGSNSSYQLGNGTTTLSRSPVKVTFLGPDYLFANNLSEYKTCIDYEAAYTDLNDDYEALDNTEKTNLSSIMISDYLTQAAYEGGTKSISVSALTKWNEICSLHASTLLGLNVVTHNPNMLINRDVLMVCLFAIVGSACLYVIIIKTRKHVNK